jgi:hypothetical protein
MTLENVTSGFSESRLKKCLRKYAKNRNWLGGRDSLPFRASDSETGCD